MIKALICLPLFCLMLMVGAVATAPSALAAPTAAVSVSETAFTTPTLAQYNNDSSSSSGSGRVSGRGVRSLVKLAIFALLGIVGVGKWLFGKMSGD
ncbi:MAG: hypothetical protein NXI04_21820 [Planctomycetaceae bacterium]|nr:hypothetical protein [Planctomycetaceae bacterium]